MEVSFQGMVVILGNLNGFEVETLVRQKMENAWLSVIAVKPSLIDHHLTFYTKIS